jgi:hypothetical protein
MQLITPFFLRKTFSRAFAFHFSLERKETKLPEHDDDDGRYRWARRENKTRFLLFLIERDTRTHTHKSRERSFFFLFFCLLSSVITLSISLKPYTLLLCFFPSAIRQKVIRYHFFTFFPPRSLCVFFSADKRRTHAHTREKNEWQSNKIMLRHASVTTRRRSFDAVVNAARAVSVFLTQKNFHFSFSFPELFFLSESAMK